MIRVELVKNKLTQIYVYMYKHTEVENKYCSN